MMRRSGSTSGTTPHTQLIIWARFGTAATNSSARCFTVHALFIGVMRSRMPESALVTLLRHCYRTPRCQSFSFSSIGKGGERTQSLRTRANPQQLYDAQTRPDSLCSPIRIVHTNESLGTVVQAAPVSKTFGGSRHHETSKEPQTVAILGGGITGLTSAYLLSKELPKAKITLLEGSSRLGGWLRSKKVEVGNGDILFEQGPRTLRPNTAAGMLTLTLIKDLGLDDELLITSKNSVAAQNRYIYYPDHLVRMPGPGQGLFDMGWSLMTEPLFKGLWRAMVRELGVPKRPASLEDESVGSFLTRRLSGSDLPNNIVSAVLHGIYAGDINQLSIKSILPLFWHMEGQHGNLTEAFMSKTKKYPIASDMTWRDANLVQELTNNPQKMARASDMNLASVYSFKEGIGQLSDTLAQKLAENPNVTIKDDTEVTGVAYDGKSGNVKITSSKRNVRMVPMTYNHVISTISGRKLSGLTESPAQLPSLAATHAVTVMVVNLYYRSSDIKPVRGFGYLIPQTVPFEQNPEMALGVVFDSDASIGQDSAAGTKLTVMLGGHLWDGYSSYPDEEQGVEMAKAVLKRHLLIDDVPEFADVGIQKECIPQYTVGHSGRMRKAHQELMSAFKGKLSVAGNSYTGVGLNDCIRAAHDVVQELSKHNGLDCVTGLESFTGETRWVQTVMENAT